MLARPLIEIKRWLVVGPFEFDTVTYSPLTSFFIEDLIQYGVKEGSMIDGSAIKNLQDDGTEVFIIDGTTPKIILTNYVRDSIEKKSNFYLFTIVNAAKAQNVTLVIDGAHSYSGWLNDEKFIEIRGEGNTNKEGDRFVNVSLKEGENILFFKVNRGTNTKSWALICAIAPIMEAEVFFGLNYAGDFVVNPFIKDSIEIYAGPYLSGKLEIMDSKDQTVISGFFDNHNTNDSVFVVSNLNSLPDGFYKTVLTVGRNDL
jgi:hypothetical protein